MGWVKCVTCYHAIMEERVFISAVHKYHVYWDARKPLIDEKLVAERGDLIIPWTEFAIQVLTANGKNKVLSCFVLLCRGMEIPYQLLDCNFSSKGEMSGLKEILKGQTYDPKPCIQ